MNSSALKWVVLTWRLPSASSTPRVTTWRTLQRMGAALLTPGAAVLPYSDDLLEQTEWLAERIVESGGEAWVLPVSELRERDEGEIRARVRSAREREYETLRAKAGHRLSHRGVVALEHGYRSVVARDHFRAAGRGRARRAIDEARSRRKAG
jgi:ChrB-like protein